MLDVTFLLRPDVSRTIVYRYRSGLLVPRVRSEIARGLSIEGASLTGEPVDRLMDSVFRSDLFDRCVLFCNWPRERRKKWASIAEEILQALSLSDPKQMVIFAHESSALFDNPKWRETLSRGLVIEEPEVTAEALPAILDYYWRSTDFPLCPIDGDAFQFSLSAQGFEKRFLRIDQFFEAMDRAMLLDFDDSSGMLIERDSLDEHEGRSSVLRPLRRLFVGGSSAVEELLQGVEVKLRQQSLSRPEIVSAMYDLARDLLLEKIENEDGSAFGAARLSSQSVVLWAISILIGIRRASQIDLTRSNVLSNAPDTFLVEIDCLCREFKRRLLSGDANPISDWWDELKLALSRFAEDSDARWPSPEVRLLVALDGLLRSVGDRELLPSWMRRLSTVVVQASDLRSQRIEEQRIL